MDDLLENEKQGDCLCEIVFLSHGFGYALSGAEGVESERAAAGSALGARSGHGDRDKGLCSVAWHLQCGPM